MQEANDDFKAYLNQLQAETTQSGKLQYGAIEVQTSVYNKIY